MEKRSLAIVVPTFRRPALLARLLADLARQNRRPDVVAVIDGSPTGSASARPVVATIATESNLTARYLPSNHANLPYQRWLGCRAVSDCEMLLYLDDDVRLPSPDIVERLVRPLESADQSIVAVTAPIAFGLSSDRPLVPKSKRRSLNFGVTRRYGPGELAPNGERIPVLPGRRDYESVGWLRGGVMAIRTEFLTRECFPDDLFALAERGWGLGEDTVLSRHLFEKGKLLCAMAAEVLHPGDSPTAAYTRETRELGYATAYSRRLVNDHFRGSAATTLGDRWALARSLAACTLLHGVRRPLFAIGFAHGALDALLRPPRAKRLYPDVDWERDADAALTNLEELPARAWEHVA